MTLKHFSFPALAASSLVLSVAAVARADAGACPQGFVPETVPGACPAIACLSDASCPVCDPKPTTTCVPGPCTTDADCATDMVCYKQTLNACSTPACPPGTTCSTTPTCSTTTESFCVPKYTLPCTVDADCGTGFTCSPQQMCACSGGTGWAEGGIVSPPSTGSTGAATGAASTVYDAGPNCTCTAGSTNYCEAKTIACTSNANCPSEWTCQEVGGYMTCGGAAYPDGGTSTPICTAVPGTLQCVPPYSQYVTPRSAAAGTYFYDKSGSPVGATAPATNTPGTGGATGSAAHANASGGCQMGNGESGRASVLALGLMGLLGLVRRRRPRA